MDKKFVKIYIKEIMMQKEFALVSYENFLNILKIKKSSVKCFYYIHHFLIHTSNVIKIIFSKNDPKNSDNPFIQDRANKIKEVLNISNNDFDLKEIRIRNDFEHFDTRIDFWVRNSKRHNYIDISIMQLNAVKGVEIADIFRNIDPEKMILTFCGKQYNLKYLKDFLEQKIKIRESET